VPLLSCLVLYTRLVLGERSPLAGEGAAALLARPPPSHHPPSKLGPAGCAVQIATRVPLSLYHLYLGPPLVNVVSLRKRPNSLSLQNKLPPCPGARQQLAAPLWRYRRLVWPCALHKRRDRGAVVGVAAVFLLA
jgi:hypothetical protein